MPFATLNKLNIFYDDQGSNEPLILIGGLGTNHLFWQGLMPSLLKEFRVIRIDNRGAGQSDISNNAYTIADMASDIVSLMDHLNIDQAFFIGHSMGSSILQELMLLKPHLVKKAILGGSLAKVPLRTSLILNTVAKLLEAELNRDLINEMLFPWLYSYNYLSDEAKALTALAAMKADPHQPSRAGFKGQLKALLQFDSCKWLCQLQIKTLIVAGEDDLLAPVECAEFIHQQINSSILKIIPHAGHMFHIEYTEILIKLISEFFDKKNL